MYQPTGIGILNGGLASPCRKVVIGYMQLLIARSQNTSVKFNMKWARQYKYMYIACERAFVYYGSSMFYWLIMLCRRVCHCIFYIYSLSSFFCFFFVFFPVCLVAIIFWWIKIYIYIIQDDLKTTKTLFWLFTSLKRDKLICIQSHLIKRQ